MKKNITNCGNMDICSKIRELRLELYKAFERKYNTEEILKISQELDIYIYHAQKELGAKIEKKD